MNRDRHPYTKLNHQLIRYHTEELMAQIAVLEEKIEVNLQEKNEVYYLRNMIEERQRFLNEYSEIATSSGSTTTQRLKLR